MFDCKPEECEDHRFSITALLQQSIINYLCSLMTSGKHKLRFSVFFSAVFLLTLAEGSMHALLHAEMHEVTGCSAHRACHNAGDADQKDPNFEDTSSDLHVVTEAGDENTCARCAQFLVQEHVHIAASLVKITDTGFAFSPERCIPQARDEKVRHSSPRGPPRA